MFEYISGKIDNIYDDIIVVDVFGIGYRIFTSYSTITNIKIGTNIKIYTNLIVKEDDFILYGFATKEELMMFKLLTSVSGVGPRASVSLLSTFTYEELIIFISTNNSSALTKATGIGKKTAERIVLELKDKVNTQMILGSINKLENNNIFEAIEALVALGYDYSIASKVVSDIEDKNKTVDNIIKDALKIISKV